jgi:ligand-binding sensor domain-containing protein
MKGGLWAADTGGFYRWAPGAGITFFEVGGVLPAKVPVHSTYRDRHGAIWVGAAGGVFKLQDGAFGRPGPDLDHVQANNFHEDRDGQMWIATTQGLLRYAGGIAARYDTAQGLSGANILSVQQDSEGNLWIGTARGGLNAMRHRAITMLSTEEGLSSNNVYPIVADRDGGVWIGAWPGLNRYHDGTVTPVVLVDGTRIERPSALLQDAAGDLWVGGYGGGVQRLHRNGPSFTSETILPEGTVVHAIYQDSRRRDVGSAPPPAWSDTSTAAREPTRRGMGSRTTGSSPFEKHTTTPSGWAQPPVSRGSETERSRATAKRRGWPASTYA